MTKKECFINEINSIIQNQTGQKVEEILSEDALDFWNGLLIAGDTTKPKFTENGKLILQYLKDNKDKYNNIFKAKEVGEGLGISSRTVSGGMRKLVTDGYVDKVGQDPVAYAITTKGIEVDLDAE